MRGLADGGVIHVQAAVDGPHHHLAGVEPDPDLHGDAMGTLELIAVAADALLHTQCRVTRPYGVIFMGQRRSEERHDAIAHHLIHRALVAVDRLHHALQYRVEELPGLLGVAVGQQLHGAFEIRKQHGHLLALAFQGGFGAENLLREIGGGVAAGGLQVSSQRGGAGGTRCWDEGRATITTKLELGRIGKPAPGARGRRGRAALAAEFHALGVLKATARAAHGCALQHGRASGWVARGQAPRRAPLTSVSGMRCQYSRWGQVSSEKHATAAEAGAEEEG
jgi:hypothetical protein